MAFEEKKLFKIVTSGNGTALKDFLDHGLSADSAFKWSYGSEFEGKTFLFVAVSKGYHDLARLLVDHGCDPDLTYILVSQNHERTLLKYEGKQRLKWTPLYQCVLKDDAEMAKILISAGCDVNIPDNHGKTPIGHAVDRNNYAVATALLSNHSCDVNICDATHLYPLHKAAVKSNIEIASLLIRHKAKIDVMTEQGSTPLILACKKASYDMVRLLLQNGANPNHAELNGRTPISFVLDYCSDQKLLDVLVKAGAKINLSDIDKWVENRLPLLQTCPAVLDVLKQVAEVPSSLQMLSILAVRKSLLSSKCDQNLDLKVHQLFLPNLIKEFLLLSHL